MHHVWIGQRDVFFGKVKNMILKRPRTTAIGIVVLGIATAFVLSAVSDSSAASGPKGESMPPEALENLERVYDLVGIPELVDFVAEERYTKCPFQGTPLDRAYSRSFKKVMGKLTEHEKMLAFGWVNPKAEDYWQMDAYDKREYLKKHPTPEGRGWIYASHNPLWTVVRLYRRFYEKHGRAPENTWELIRDTRYGEVLLKGSAPRTGDTLENPELFRSVISPVTGKLIEFTHEELSPGNMWIAVVDKETLDKVAEKWVGVGPEGEPLPMTKFEGTIYYYRAYGHKGIIRTGMLFVTEYSIGIQ